MRQINRNVYKCSLPVLKYFLLPLFLSFAFSIPGAAHGEVSLSPEAAEGVLFRDTYDPDCLKYSELAEFEGVGGTGALKLTPDKWHRPAVVFYCGGDSRRDFTTYDTIQFDFCSPDGDTGNPSFNFETWDQSSNTVFVRDYIEGGILDNTWRRVVIPLEALKTSDWSLGNVEDMAWNKDELNRTFYLDNVVLKSITPLELISSGKDAPFPENNTVLRLRFDKRYNEQNVRDPANYKLYSNTDPAYMNPQHPVETGIQYRVTGFTDSKRPVICWEAFLQFRYPFGNGREYLLTVENVRDSSGDTMETTRFQFLYDDLSLANTNIKINQVGYLPGAPKIGYVGGFLGDLGGDGWAVGDGGTIFRWTDRSSWQAETSPVDTALRAVAAIRKDAAWAVGDGGIILRWNGVSWSQMGSPTTEDLLAIHFGPRNIGWISGKNGVIIRIEKGTIKIVSTPTKQTLRGIWAGPEDTAWAVGDGGTILKWENGQWSPDEVPLQDDLHAIGGLHADWLWASGKNGSVLLHRYGRWNRYDEIPFTSTTLNAVTCDLAGQTWIAGNGGLLWRKSGFGSSPFETQANGSTNDIFALARQNARTAWAVGRNGLYLRQIPHSWEKQAGFSLENLYGLCALPYGAMRIPDSLPNARIRDINTGETVLSIPLELRAANWALSGEDVYAFDFSSLSSPGAYQVHIAGIGLSDPFIIGEESLAHAAMTAARGLYYQRSGSALQPPWAEERFSRPLSHEFDLDGRIIDAAFHTSLPGTPLYNGETPGDVVDTHGGWYDAGDYGKYLPTAAVALWFLLTAYDMSPASFTDSQWNIPESGNGVPDLLDEARWEIDWITKMQALDGGVYHKLTAETWFSGMPHEQDGPRFLYEKTTHDTAIAAAILSLSARLWQKFDPELADDYLTRSERAWAFLESHPYPTPEAGFHNPANVRTGEYNDGDDTDNRLWAAAELYRTTGKEKYRNFFEQWWHGNSHTSGWNNWQHHYKSAYWAYLRSVHEDADGGIQKEIEEKIIRDADKVEQFTLKNPYHNGARLDVPDWIGWGVFTQSMEYAFPLLQAWTLTCEKKYLAAAALNLDAQMGANPLSFSFITGIGKRYPRDPLHKISTYDQTVEPVPGIPVFGVFAHMSNGQSYYLATQSDENSYPQSYSSADPYPVLRRYIDARELVPMSEFTIVDMAITAGVLNIMTGLDFNDL